MINYIKTFILLCAVAVVSGVTVMKVSMYQGGEQVPVPNVTGERIIPALGKLGDSELYLKIMRLEFSPTVPKDLIISQKPEPGTTSKKGRDVKVIISRGSKETIIPDLVGSTLRRAEAILSRNGVKIRRRIMIYADAPEKTILAHRPPARTRVNRGDGVTALISRGPAPKYVATPSFVDEPVSFAMHRIKNLDLKISRVTYAPSSETARGVVLAQSPPFGSRAIRGAFVELTVSEGAAEGSDDTATFSFLYYTVPDGPAAVKVSIYQDNLDGEKEVYNRVHRPGDTLSLLVRVKGTTAAKIFINNELAEVKRF